MWDSQLISLAYDAALDSKRWVTFAEALEHSLGGAVVALAIPQPERDHRGVWIAPSLTAPFVESYREHCFALDPWAEHASSLAVGAVASGCGAWWAGRIARSAFAREWLEPQGLALDCFLGCVVDRDEQNGISLVSVFRREGTRRPRPGAWDLDAELVAHLRRAVQIHFRRLAIEAERDAYARVLDCVPLATILVDERGQVRRTNRAAERLLAGRDGLAIGRDGVDADKPESTQRLRRAIADASHGGEPAAPGSALSIERSSGRRPLRAVVKPLGTRSAGRVAGASAVLFVSDPDACSEAPRELLRSFFGLTLAESALTHELTRGRSLAEAARRLDITYGTARQRLGQVFAKTETRRQAELVHLVLSGPESLLAEE